MFVPSWQCIRHGARRGCIGRDEAELAALLLHCSLVPSQISKAGPVDLPPDQSQRRPLSATVAGRAFLQPPRLARIEPDELERFFRGCGWTPYFVEGDEPEKMHELMATVLEKAIEDIRQIQKDARDKIGTSRC